MQPDRVPPIERLGNDVGALRKILSDLLRQVGVPANCGKCNHEVLLIRHAGKEHFTSYNLDGTYHFGTCRASELFQKKQGELKERRKNG
jgi:hypothetical protein